MYSAAEDQDWEPPLPTEQSRGSASFSPLCPRIPQQWTARLSPAEVLAAGSHSWLNAAAAELNGASSSSQLVRGLRSCSPASHCEQLLQPEQQLEQRLHHQQQVAAHILQLLNHPKSQQNETQEWSSVTSRSSQAQVGEERNANQAASLEYSSSQEVHDLGRCLPCYFDHRHRKSPGHYPACSKESCWTRRCHRPHSDAYVSHARTLETRYHKKARKASQKQSNQGSTAGQLDNNPSSSSQATASSNGFFATPSHVAVPNVVCLHNGLSVQFLGSF